MVICLVRGADLHTAQLTPLPLTVSSVKSRLVLPFWYRLTRVVPEKRAVKWVCVCVCVGRIALNYGSVCDTKRDAILTCDQKRT